jgi:hypothetical protein
MAAGCSPSMPAATTCRSSPSTPTAGPGRPRPGAGRVRASAEPARRRPRPDRVQPRWRHPGGDRAGDRPYQRLRGRPGRRRRGPHGGRFVGGDASGFDFTRAGVLVVTEAAAGKVGAASASTCRLAGPGSLSLVSGSVGNTRSEVCWAAVSPDDRYVYVTNFGDGTVSSYMIAEDRRLDLLRPVAATTVEGQRASATRP